MMTLLRNNAKNDIIRINQNQKPETAERASMKVDIISNEAAEKYEVRERTDDETEPGAVLFQGDCQEDCEDFCERYGHKFRFRKEVIHFPAKFLADVEKRANKVRAEMDEDAAKIGWKFGTHVTYRASAAWKDEPTHYCYLGDHGGTGQFNGYTKETAGTSDGKRALQGHVELIGMFEALWELGLTLTFDEAGKHKVYGKYPEWITVDHL